MKPMKRVALLHSLCTVGKASMTNMIPVFSAMGIEVCPIPTVLLSTHTGGYGLPARQTVDASYLRECAEHFVKNDIDFDVIFVGYLGNVELAKEVLHFVECFPSATVIVDPIMGDNGQFYGSLNKDYVEVYLTLCQRAGLILPNLTEACFLSEERYENIKTQEDVQRLLEALQRKGLGKMILTSIPTNSNQIAVAVLDDGQAEVLSFQEEEARFHGTGDVFDAVIVGTMLQGKKLCEAVIRAHSFTVSCIRESVKASYPKREGLMIEKCLSLLV